MSLRTGSLVAMIVLAVGGGIYLLSDGGSGSRSGALGEREDQAPTDVATTDEDLDPAADVALDLPAAAAGSGRAVAAPSEETALEAAASDEPDELDRSSVAILSGTVRDERGLAIEGANVLASHNAMELLAADSFGAALGLMSPELGERFVETTTDRDGSFELVGIPPGQPGLRIEAQGFVPQVKTDVLIAAREHQELDAPIVLDASPIVTGIVLDPNGAPVAGARVTTKKKNAGMMGGAMFGNIPNLEEGVRTAADGTFRLDTLKPEELVVVVSHELFAEGQADADTREGDALEVEVRLEKGSSIQGRVLGVTAEAAESLRLLAIPADFNPMQSISLHNASVASDGTFEVWGLQEGTKWNLVGREGEDESTENLGLLFMGLERGLATNRVEAAAGDRDVELEYRAAGTILFQAVDADTGRPITRLNVTSGAGRYFGEPEEFVEYADGRVRLEGQRPEVDEEAVRVIVDAVGYQRRMESVKVPGPSEVDLGTLKLSPTEVAQFLVIDAVTRVPVEGVVVTVTPKSENGHRHESSAMLESFDYGSNFSGTSDEDGIARVETTLDGSCRVVATSGDHGPFRMDDVELQGSDVVPITLELRAGATVRVSATDLNGIPLPARKIEHRPPSGRSSPWSFESNDLVTDANGRASFVNLEAGSHAFRIAKLETVSDEPNLMMMMMAMERGREDDEDSWTTVDVANTGTEELVLVELPSGSLRGRVTEAGEPLRRATLTLRKVGEGDEELDEGLDAGEAVLAELGRDMAGQGVASTRTERDGSFTLEGVETGDYVLEIDHRKRAMPVIHELTIVTGEQVQDFDLDLAILSGKVVDEEGEGVKGALVSVIPYLEPSAAEDEGSGLNTELARELMGDLFGLDGEFRTFKTKSSGAFELRGVTPDVRLVVHVDGAQVGYQNTKSEPLELRSDEERDDLVLVVGRGGTLDITVLEPDDEAPDFVLLRLVRVDAAMKPLNEIAPGGVKTVTGLTPGTYRVIADDDPDEEALFGTGDPSEIGKVEATVEVVGGETRRVELRLPE